MRQLKLQEVFLVDQPNQQLLGASSEEKSSHQEVCLAVIPNQLVAYLETQQMEVSLDQNQLKVGHYSVIPQVVFSAQMVLQHQDHFLAQNHQVVFLVINQQEQHYLEENQENLYSANKNLYLAKALVKKMIIKKTMKKTQMATTSLQMSHQPSQLKMQLLSKVHLQNFLREKFKNSRSINQQIKRKTVELVKCRFKNANLDKMTQPKSPFSKLFSKTRLAKSFTKAPF